MGLKNIDSNFLTKKASQENVDWYDPRDERLSLFGVFFSEEEGRFVRIEKKIADTVSEKVGLLASYTAGGRVSFETDSDRVFVKATLPHGGINHNMTPDLMYGFPIYDGDTYLGCPAPDSIPMGDEDSVTPAQLPIATVERTLSVDDSRATRPEKEKHKITVYMPLYDGVCEMKIGVDKDSYVKPYNPYKRKGRIVFYGSSITHGASASRPGNDYISLLSRWLSSDVLNLGFAGNACGEAAMAEYIASLPATAYVMDYDFNAPTPEHLRRTHYPFYKTLREKNPDTPILMLSRPPFEYSAEAPERREIVRATYLRSLEEGDNRVAFIDGETLFGRRDRHLCTQDTCHPSDLGFYRMAKKIYPVLKRLLDK